MISSIVIFIILLFDIIYSCVVAYNLRNQIIMFSELKNEKLAKIPGMLEQLLKRRINGFKKYPTRLLKAFPYIKKTNEKEFEIIRKLQTSKKKKNNTKKVKKKLVSNK